MKSHFALALLCAVLLIAVEPAYAATLGYGDNGKYGRDQFDQHGDRNSHSDNDSDYRPNFFNENDNKGSHSDWDDFKSNGGKSNYSSPSSWHDDGDHSHHFDDYKHKISYPEFPILGILEGGRYDHDKHGIGDGDHDFDDHRDFVKYFKDICDHKNDRDDGGYRHCKSGDPSAVPLPDALPLFALGLMLLSSVSLFKARHKKAAT